VNALALLGWSYDDKTTMFSVEELVEKFRISRVSKSPAVFDLKRLEVMNGRYLRLMSDEEFEEVLVEYLAKTGYIAERGEGAEELVRRSAPLVKRKMSTMDEYDGLAGWLFRPLEIEPEAWESLTVDVKHSIQVIGGGLGRLETLSDFSVESIRAALSDQLHIMGESARDFLEPQRIAITGQTVSTGIYESLALLGREEAFARYRDTLGRLGEMWAAA
jgi:glutamyl-tRNA synthetase